MYSSHHLLCSILCDVHCAVHSVHRFKTVGCVVCTVCSSQCHVHSIQCTVFCALLSVHCAAHCAVGKNALGWRQWLCRTGDSSQSLMRPLQRDPRAVTSTTPLQVMHCTLARCTVIHCTFVHCTVTLCTVKHCKVIHCTSGH